MAGSPIWVLLKNNGHIHDPFGASTSIHYFQIPILDIYITLLNEVSYIREKAFGIEIHPII